MNSFAQSKGDYFVLFDKMNSFRKQGCKLSKLQRIDKVDKDKIVIEGKEFGKKAFAQIYGELKIGNYGVIVRCGEQYFLIVFPGGLNGPAIY